MPKNISDSATLPDDYYKKRVSFTDEFWAINLDTQEAIRIFIPENERLSLLAPLRKQPLELLVTVSRWYMDIF